MLGMDEQDFGFDYKAIYIKENMRYYRGNSMRGTFQIGDRLLIKPVLIVDIIPGDIIVYQRPNNKENTEEMVHRVVALREGKLITRGDQNRTLDLTPVQSNQIIGKVIAKENRGYRQVVVGGEKGLQRAKLRWAILRLNRFAYRLFIFPYRLFRNSRFISMLWRPVTTKIHLKTEGGLVVKYIYKQKTIAIWEAASKRFNCRKPYDLVIFPPED